MKWGDLLAVSLLLCVVGSCDSVSGTGDQERPGNLAFFGDTAEIVAPDTASAEESVTVTVSTFGSGCARKGRTESEPSDDLLILKPFDVEIAEGVVCPQILRRFEHRVETAFSAPGEVTVRAEGRAVDGDGVEDLDLETTIVIE